ncbi:hypothetical protein INT47_012496 [Mucor saturninus]|uniref:thioredoxin-dependent peroxiredoxin n=1 Tax=Mucor saturninus TaxID=64648 RepID=A0A8H7QP86_9FUNG|nr:hypothetical protein INT47_012496 [Mucor saturninus]
MAQVQKPAPCFTSVAVVDGEFKDISIADYLGKYVVLFWYPLDFTFVCPTEVIAFSDAYNRFKALDCELIAASCDSEYTHHAWLETPRRRGGLGRETRIPIIADKTRRIAKSYGIYIEEEGITLRGLFIIDPNGIVRQITINDLPVGRNVEEVLRLVEAFQFTDKHGEVCPANWVAGSRAITPDTKEARNYFNDTN